MKKTMLFLFSGLFLLGGSIYLAYFFLSGIDKGVSPLFLLLSLVSLGGSVYLLLRASHTDTEPVDMPVQTPAEAAKAKSILDRNNKLVEDFKQTNDARERLKMLEAAGRAQEGK